MSKRFTETTIWRNPWFRKLTPVQKCLWSYLKDNCDLAGVLDFDIEDAEHCIGGRVKPEDLEVFKGRVVTLKNGKLLLPRFVKFQIGDPVESCHAHKPVLKCIESHGLRYPFQDVLGSLPNNNVGSLPDKSVTLPSDNVGREQEQVQEKEEEKERGSVRGKFVRPTNDEALAYGREIDLCPEQVGACLDYWDSAGWRRKNGPVVDWKATMRTWKGNLPNFQRQNGNGVVHQAIQPEPPMTKDQKTVMGWITRNFTPPDSHPLYGLYQTMLAERL